MSDKNHDDKGMDSYAVLDRRIVELYITKPNGQTEVKYRRERCDPECQDMINQIERLQSVDPECPYMWRYAI